MKKFISFILLSGVFLVVSEASESTVVNASSSDSINQTITLPENQDGIPTLPGIQSRAVTKAYVTDVIKYFQGYPPGKVAHGQTIGGSYLVGTLTRTSVRGIQGGYVATYAGWLYK